ncbi:VOC family protein [Povalibacter sp.]|uniref:VOC family protein n=1 Tax=Povalibacter sp. TaxID=1962978 RepID=UPI002F3E40BA
MIHHLCVGSGDIPRARRFYDAALGILGMRLLKQDDVGIHYGTGDIFFSVVRPTNGHDASAGNGVHIAFVARNHPMVTAFYEAALRHGGRDAGAPGVRHQYAPNYFGAFVFDPDGNKIEAVALQSVVQ